MSIADAFGVRFFRPVDHAICGEALTEAIGHSGMFVVHVPLMTPSYSPEDKMITEDRAVDDRRHSLLKRHILQLRGNSDDRIDQQ